MPKPSKNHSYSDEKAFIRLMLLIAVILKHPGIGSSDCEEREVNSNKSLEPIQTEIRKLAAELNINFPENYPKIPTTRKDLEVLKKYQILQQRMYRWGYYLGTGVMSLEELKIALQALHSQGKYQGDALVRKIEKKLTKRLRNLDKENQGKFFYPVRCNINSVINYTDPEEMMEQGEYRNTLFHHIETLEKAIINGEVIEIFRSKDLYQQQGIGMVKIYPLQLIYYNIAWYLIFENHQDNCLAIGRIDRYSNYCQVLNLPKRAIKTQEKSLENAHQLLTNGWGLFLGNKEEQLLELEGKLPLETVRVRFFPPMTKFIQEGEKRHPQQQIFLGEKDDVGELKYVDYQIKLPPRSHQEFLHWVQGYFDKAIIITPETLRKQHQEGAKNLYGRYFIDNQ
ncbi:MAG: WYL domain-containing protein [Gomphosphaeria aponina SAG 52.96 = DSM 107014]|uniref:WYL domain-containing protein n=1 Tax=Gomphosphaeria aponina SAG 52.96 = DSM 107014 TaxID=1521640 RepID=A0A941GXV3_9CHRO|nr:WYL domain-containing protein [Gomphosphaeria aponina SAG 52.96 = DSM 107014]